ncbi:MAG TPA: bifunctional 5,10-methylenetetrahydrofolate dehydrogenase/5,10-methenyltetrahydrofolate cyclohydrolase [Syntrophomonadaceae bacterium]|nr:bifunctional 5,10-methylenetetrahydrofolate dehydrogenase/5,10-methenyltetrahydrofolate cyclohydrolase [Syntrophomonadaceae bacterium]
MPAIVLDGKVLASQIEADLIKAVVKMKELNANPGIAVVQVMGNPASDLYAKVKEKACQRTGIHFRMVRLPDSVNKMDLISVLRALNSDEGIDGLLLQMPLPNHLDVQEIIEEIAPNKDVDCFHPYNMGRLFIGKPGLKPCTPMGCMVLLERSGIILDGNNAVVLGRSNIVGKPLAMLLMQKNSTVTVCHQKSKHIDQELKEADIVVAAIGNPQSINGSNLKPGCVVIDVGQHRMPDGRIVGDVDYPSASAVAGWITPVPGGIGPMTVAMLMYNTLWAAAKKREIHLDQVFSPGLIDISKYLALDSE